MKRKYGVAGTAAVILIVLAWIVLVVGVAVSILAGLMVAGYVDYHILLDWPDSAYVALLTLLGILGSLLYFALLLGFALVIRLLIGVERNTRESAYRLRTGKREEFEPIE